jgi:hypothetical protein
MSPEPSVLQGLLSKRRLQGQLMVELLALVHCRLSLKKLPSRMSPEPSVLQGLLSQRRLQQMQRRNALQQMQRLQRLEL